MNHEFAASGPINADLRIAAGSLNVTAGDKSVITVSVAPADGSSASQEAAKETRVHLEGKHLVVHTPHGKGWALFKWPKLNITVELPQESTITVKAASADVRCEGVYKDLVAHTASGDLWLDRVQKDVSVISASGNVRIGWVGGDLRANSASGDITAHHVVGKTDANTASGDIKSDRSDSDVRAKTASGDVSVGVARQGEIKVHTASGDISVGVAAGTGVWLDLNTVSGRTLSDLAMSGSGAPIDNPTAQLSIKVRTASGDIALRRVA